MDGADTNCEHIAAALQIAADVVLCVRSTAVLLLRVCMMRVVPCTLGSILRAQKTEECGGDWTALYPPDDQGPLSGPP